MIKIQLPFCDFYEYHFIIELLQSSWMRICIPQVSPVAIEIEALRASFKNCIPDFYFTNFQNVSNAVFLNS